MHATRFIVLLLASLGAGLLQADPLRAVLPEHRVLSSSEADSFESALLQALVEGLGEKVVIVGQGETSDLQLGGSRSGVAYFQSEPSALTASEGGVTDWPQLRSQTFCVTEANPYAALVEERFGGEPREYPSTAHALIGLKLGECVAVVEDQRLLAEMASLPEWRRYNAVLPALPGAEQVLRLSAESPKLQQRVATLMQGWTEEGRLEELIRFWIDEVAFQAYVLADTLDCH